MIEADGEAMALFDGTARAVLIVTLLSGTCSAAAQLGKPLTIEARTLTHTRDGQVAGCGLRFTGGEARSPVSSWFDVSLNVFRRGIAIAQSIAYDIRRSELEGDTVPAIAPVESTWLRPGEGIARRGENSERTASLIYTLVPDDAVEVFEAVAKGEPVTVAIKRWTEPSETIYTGPASMDDQSRRDMSACLAELLQD
jgi:hypothetical protein